MPVVKTSSFPIDRTPHRRARWLLVVWLGFVGLIMVNSASLAEAAGCQHAQQAVSATQPLHVDASLLGKWQYAGGDVYYLFHPLPQPCDGPGCRQAPEPASEMGVIPTAPQRPFAPANHALEALRSDDTTFEQYAFIDQICNSPTLSGLLRPPRQA